MGEISSSELITRFRQACAIEGREHALTGREYRITGGTRLSGSAGRYLYRFEQARKLPIKEDTFFSLTFNGHQYDATLVSRSHSSLTLSLAHDLGPTISEGSIVIQSADLLSALEARLVALESCSDGFNASLASRLFSASAQLGDVVAEPVHPTDGLTEEQRRAVSGLSAQSISFLWGPPGTGKTATLSALIHALYTSNRRVLIVAHTNQAVDGLLETLCKRISGRAKLAIPEGSVIRIGPIVREDLAEAFGSQVELESVVRHRLEKTSSRLEAMERERDKLRERISSLESSVTLIRAEEGLAQKLALLQENRRQTRPGLFATLRRLFFGGGRVVPVVVDETADLDGEIRLLESGLLKLKESLSAFDRSSLGDELTDAKDQDRELAHAIDGLRHLMTQLRSTIIAGARVVATSATRAFLQPELLSGFDLVVVDEASMLPLPVSFLLAGLAQRQVVIAGDFRQLPPITLAQDPIVKEWYGRDIFEASGIVDLADQGRDHPSLFSLTKQFRGREEIASLFNETFYRGVLTTEYAPALSLTFSDPLSILSDRPVVLVDTASLAPAGQTIAKSKANLLHALLVREIVSQFQRCLPDAQSSLFGVISPYRPQVELIQEILAEGGKKGFAIGTVHRFQGDERPIVILDLTESSPHRLGSFLGGTSVREAGAKLLNVALSRAKEMLVIVANLAYLRAQLREEHLLSGIVRRLESSGCVVDASLFIDLQELPSEDGELRRPGSTFQTYTRALFLSALFDDLRRANRSAILASPRISKDLVKMITSVLASRPTTLALEIVVPPYSPEVCPSIEEYDASLELFSQLGATLSTSYASQTGLVIVDDSIAWLGALNPLACLESDVGTMTRCSSVVAVSALKKVLPQSASPASQPAAVSG